MRDVAHAARALCRRFDPDQAALYASLAGFPQAQIGNAPGNYIPNAPAMWPRPASRSARRLAGSARCAGAIWREPAHRRQRVPFAAVSTFNGRVGYRSDNGWRMQLDALNLLNTKTNQITYAYGSLIKTDSLYNLCFPARIAPAAGVPERRDGSCPASDRAVGDQTYACRNLLRGPPH